MDVLRFTGDAMCRSIVTLCLIAAMLQAAPRVAAAQTPPPSDSIRDGATRGALAGVAAGAAWMVFTGQACGRGCEMNAVPVFGLLTMAAGPVVGLIVDRANGRASVRLGGMVTRVRHASLNGDAVAPGGAIAVQLLPFFRLHAEFSRVNHTFDAPPGSVPDEVRANAVFGGPRIAGVSRGLHSNHVAYAFSELVGVPVPIRGRARVEILAGATLKKVRALEYYDAVEQTGSGTTTTVRRIPGRYMILDFETPDVGAVVGIDAEIPIVGGLTAVPTIRYQRWERSGGAVSFGAGAHWRF